MISEAQVTVTAADGVKLEAFLALPAAARAGLVVCHPHPLYGGDMETPVVTTIVEVAQAKNLASLRFNFRGVGRSTGTHGGGLPEVADARAAVDDLRARMGAGIPIGIAGYSFGAAVAMRVAASGSVTGLVLVAPPIATGMPRGLPPIESAAGPMLVIAGTRDDYCPEDRLAALVRLWPKATVHRIDGADHFFSGRLGELSAALDDWLATQ